MISLDGESDQKTSSYNGIPSDFFEDMECVWKGRVKRIHIEYEIAEVEKAAEALSLAVSLGTILFFFFKLWIDIFSFILLTDTSVLHQHCFTKKKKKESFIVTTWRIKMFYIIFKWQGKSQLQTEILPEPNFENKFDE